MTAATLHMLGKSLFLLKPRTPDTLKQMLREPGFQARVTYPTSDAEGKSKALRACDVSENFCQVVLNYLF